MPALLSGRYLGIAAVLAAAAFVFALFSQHVLGLQPCAWCILQRMICLALAVVCGLGWLLRRNGAAVGIAALFGLALAAGGAMAAWYQHTVASNLFSCDLTLADRVVTGSGLDAAMPSVFGIYATCADTANLLGVRYELWTLALFVVLGALCVAALIGRLRRPRVAV